MRGQIWLVMLDPAAGAGTRKTRPAVVLSPEEMNAHLNTLIVAPLTSEAIAAPFRVPLSVAGTRGVILLDQLRAVGRDRLTKKLGSIAPRTLDRVLAALQELFAR